MDSGHTRFTRNLHRKREVWPGRITRCVKGGISVVAAGFLFCMFVSIAGADELTMKNGDRLQGTVVSMSLGKLVFKTSYAGEITIKWEEVEKLTTDQPLEAYLQDEETLIGKIKAQEDGALVLDPADGSPPVAVQLAKVKSLERPKPPAGWEFTGNVSAGASKETGNTNTEKYHLIGNLKVSKLPHVIKLYGEFHKEWSSDKLSKDNALGSATYERFIDKKWFVFGNAMAETDKFKDLDLLTNVAVGPGYQFWRSERKNLSVKLGPAYAYEKYSKPMGFLNNKNQRDYFAGFWALDFDMWFFDRFFQIYHHDDIVYSFQDSENWVVRTRTGIRIPMVMKLFASFQFDYDYANQPADGKKNYDQSWNFGLGWAF